MNRFFISLAAIFIFGFPQIPNAAPPKVKIKPAKFTPPQAERVLLKNGAIVYLMEDRDLPLLEVTLRLKSSPAYEFVPDAFEIMGAAWRMGGTSRHLPAEFDRRMEDMATDFAISTDHESVFLTLSCLSKNSEESLSLFWDMTFRPDFHQERLDLIREKELEKLRRKNETPAEIGRRAFRDVLYGSAHVYAQNPTTATVQALRRDHLRQIHEAVVAPEGAILTVSGDFDRRALLENLETNFGNRRLSGRSHPEYNFSLQNPPAGKNFYVEKDFTQSRVIFGRVGPSRRSIDQFSLKIADYILGSGGPSRLFSEIRSRRGLAYAVGSFFVEREGPGMVGVVCQTMAPATIVTVKAIQEELEKFSSHGPTAEELKMAKDATINSFLFTFESPAGVVSALSSMEFFGYPADFLQKFTSNISRLTVTDIRRVAKKYYSPNEMKIVVVGDKTKFQGSLDELGEIIRVPLETLD